MAQREGNAAEAIQESENSSEEYSSGEEEVEAQVTREGQGVAKGAPADQGIAIPFKEDPIPENDAVREYKQKTREQKKNRDKTCKENPEILFKCKDGTLQFYTDQPEKWLERMRQQLNPVETKTSTKLETKTSTKLETKASTKLETTKGTIMMYSNGKFVIYVSNSSNDFEIWFQKMKNQDVTDQMEQLNLNDRKQHGQAKP